MKKLFLFLAVLMAVSMTAGTAMAVPFGDGGVGLQGVLDGITVGGASSVTAASDFLSDSDATNQKLNNQIFHKKKIKVKKTTIESLSN